MDSVEEAGAFCGTCRLSKHNREIFHGNAKRNDRPAEIKLRLSGMPDFFFFSRIRTQNATNREREREREREKKPWHSKHGLKPPYEFITVRLRAFFYGRLRYAWSIAIEDIRLGSRNPHPFTYPVSH